MGVQRQRAGDATPQGIVHHKVHGPEVGQGVALHGAPHGAGVMGLHTFDGEQLRHQGVVLRVAGNHGQGGTVALVA